MSNLCSFLVFFFFFFYVEPVGKRTAAIIHQKANSSRIEYLRNSFEMLSVPLDLWVDMGSILCSFTKHNTHKASHALKTACNIVKKKSFQKRAVAIEYQTSNRRKRHSFVY